MGPVRSQLVALYIDCRLQHVAYVQEQYKAWPHGVSTSGVPCVYHTVTIYNGTCYH